MATLADRLQYTFSTPDRRRYTFSDVEQRRAMHMCLNELARSHESFIRIDMRDLQTRTATMVVVHLYPLPPLSFTRGKIFKGILEFDPFVPIRGS